MAKHKRRLSKISTLHYFKLVFRSILFLLALVTYILIKLGVTSLPENTLDHRWIVPGIIGGVFVIEMILRFFPSSLESMGCQKQFKKNFISTEQEKPTRSTWKSTLAVAVAWFLLNGVIGVLYFTHVIDVGILILISLAYSICDMICILFFCPFQTWFMKNKCCGSCRIYNWDFAMMFTPLVFIPHFYTWTLLGISLLLLLFWEVALLVHRERFSEETNACLSCANCKEKLCHHKKQLRHFLKKNREIMLLKGNAVVDKVETVAKTEKAIAFPQKKRS